MFKRPRFQLVLLALLALMTGCGTQSSSAPLATLRTTQTIRPTTMPTPMPTPMPTDVPSPAPTTGEEHVIVTFQTHDQQFRILLTEPADVAHARDLLAGAEDAPLPNGRVVRDGDGGVNVGYSWHIDPQDVEFADLCAEIYDGQPSDVAADPVTYQRFCPWSARVVDIQPAP